MSDICSIDGDASERRYPYGRPHGTPYGLSGALPAPSIHASSIYSHSRRSGATQQLMRRTGAPTHISERSTTLSVGHRKKERLRWVIYLGVLLPVLAGIIGVVAYAVSSESLDATPNSRQKLNQQSDLNNRMLSEEAILRQRETNLFESDIDRVFEASYNVPKHVPTPAPTPRTPSTSTRPPDDDLYLFENSLHNNQQSIAHVVQQQQHVRTNADIQRVFSTTLAPKTTSSAPARQPHRQQQYHHEEKHHDTLDLGKLQHQQHFQQQQQQQDVQQQQHHDHAHEVGVVIYDDYPPQLNLGLQQQTSHIQHHAHVLPPDNNSRSKAQKNQPVRPATSKQTGKNHHQPTKEPSIPKILVDPQDVPLQPLPPELIEHLPNLPPGTIVEQQTMDEDKNTYIVHFVVGDKEQKTSASSVATTVSTTTKSTTPSTTTTVTTPQPAVSSNPEEFAAMLKQILAATKEQQQKLNQSPQFVILAPPAVPVQSHAHTSTSIAHSTTPEKFPTTKSTVQTTQSTTTSPIPPSTTSTTRTSTTTTTPRPTTKSTTTTTTTTTPAPPPPTTTTTTVPTTVSTTTMRPVTRRKIYAVISRPKSTTTTTTTEAPLVENGDEVDDLEQSESFYESQEVSSVAPPVQRKSSPIPPIRPQATYRYYRITTPMPYRTTSKPRIVYRYSTPPMSQPEPPAPAKYYIPQPRKNGTNPNPFRAPEVPKRYLSPASYNPRHSNARKQEAYAKPPFQPPPLPPTAQIVRRPYVVNPVLHRPLYSGSMMPQSFMGAAPAESVMLPIYTQKDRSGVEIPQQVEEMVNDQDVEEEQTEQEAPEEKSGITFTFGGGKPGDRGYGVSPIGIVRNLFRPFLTRRKTRSNNRVVFGVVVENTDKSGKVAKPLLKNAQN